jgi:multidrug efflux pump subunit AcrB
MRRLFNNLLRWTLVFLVVLGLGFLLAVYFIYRPAASRLSQSEQQMLQMQEQAKTELDQANQQIGELQQRVQDLSTLETRNIELQTGVDSTLMHVYILSARNDVANAQLALAQEDSSGARAALGKTDQTLKDLASLLDADHQKTVADMQERLALALKGIDANPNAAVSDLSVLATDLLELETGFFARP